MSESNVIRFPVKPRFNTLDQFTQGYITTALLMTEDSLDHQLLYENLHPRTVECMIEICRSFEADQRDNLEIYYDHGLAEDQAGTDLWLTQHHTGSGYEQRGLDKIITDELSRAACKYSEIIMVSRYITLM